MNDQKVNIAFIATIQPAIIRLDLLSFLTTEPHPHVLKTELYQTEDFPSFLECLKNFLSEFEETANWPTQGILAVPGIPFDNNVTITDCHWPEINGVQVTQEFKLSKVKLINSFSVIGYEVLKTSENQLTRVQEAEVSEEGTGIVIGCSQYLGECTLRTMRTTTGNHVHQVFETQGGLKQFTPTNEDEWEYSEHLMNESPDLNEKYGYLPLDKAFCGDAITKMHEYLSKKDGTIPSRIMAPGEILLKGMMKKDPLCEKTLEMFTRLLGVEVSNFALETLPTKGIYLTGGYITMLEKYLTQPNNMFLKGYYGKGTIVNEKLSKFPIFIIKRDDMIMSGCIEELKKML